MQALPGLNVKPLVADGQAAVQASSPQLMVTFEHVLGFPPWQSSAQVPAPSTAAQAMVAPTQALLAPQLTSHPKVPGQATTTFWQFPFAAQSTAHSQPAGQATVVFAQASPPPVQSMLQTVPLQPPVQLAGQDAGGGVGSTLQAQAFAPPQSGPTSPGGAHSSSGSVPAPCETQAPEALQRSHAPLQALLQQTSSTQLLPRH